MYISEASNLQNHQNTTRFPPAAFFHLYLWKHGRTMVDASKQRQNLTMRQSWPHQYRTEQEQEQMIEAPQIIQMLATFIATLLQTVFCLYVYTWTNSVYPSTTNVLLYLPGASLQENAQWNFIWIFSQPSFWTLEPNPTTGALGHTIPSAINIVAQNFWIPQKKTP